MREAGACCWKCAALLDGTGEHMAFGLGLGLGLGWARMWFAGVLLGSLLTGGALAEKPGVAGDAAGASEGAVPGAVQGRVQDPDGAWVLGASVRLEVGDARVSRATLTDGQGKFVFRDVPAGAYHLVVTAPGLAPWKTEGEVDRRTGLDLADLVLGKAVASAEVQVTAERTEIGAAQVQMEEKQRVLGVIPNFYAVYVWDAEPLTARQKFDMAWKMSADPVSVLTSASMAGIEQAQNSFAGYRQGAAGYSKRFSAAYGDTVASTMLGQAVFPAIFRQDPRYFVKGRGSVMSRGLYAISSAVVCRGDNRKWQPNYSNMVGNVTSAALSNVYYPATDRRGAGLLIRNSMVTTGMGAIGGLFQEFVVRHFTPHVPDYEAN